MAFITVRNATVTAVNPKGFTLTESFTSKMTGELFTKEYKVWSDESVAEGSVINVSGIFSAKVNTYDPNLPTVEIHINKPRIEAFVPKPVVAADAPF